MIFVHRPSMRSVLARALLLGIVTGLRSAAGLAALARHAPEAPRHAEWRHWPVLGWHWGRIALNAAWLGEFVADKLPSTPPRTQPGALGGRVLFGMLAGLAVGSERHGTAAKVGGALAGGAGAVVGSYGGYHARRWAEEATGLPDLPVALIEDAAATALAEQAVRG